MCHLGSSVCSSCSGFQGNFSVSVFVQWFPFLLFALHTVIFQNYLNFCSLERVEGVLSHTGEHDSCGARMSLVVVAHCLCMRLGSSIVCMKTDQVKKKLMRI